MLRCRVFQKSESAEAYARRRDEILTAAEHCFVKAGFHRTTIQNIAVDAGMSVGNVYRYFTSKDAVVEALVGRDQAKTAEDFDSLRTDDPMGAFGSLMRRQIVENGQARSVLWLEICAEAARNPTVAAVTRAHEQAIAAHLTSFFTRVLAERSRAGLPGAADPHALARMVITLFCGLMVRQAMGPATEAPAGVDQMLAVVSAAVAGDVAPALEAGTKIEVYA